MRTSSPLQCNAAMQEAAGCQELPGVLGGL